MAFFRMVLRTSFILFAVVLVLIIMLEYKSLSASQNGNELLYYESQSSVLDLDLQDPVILWWTPLTGEKGHSKKCGSHSCFFTVNRAYQHHRKTQAFAFYGTDLHYGDLPVPRLPHHEWGLLHEESPKNNYLLSHQGVLALFNHTATFRRESDLPLTLQYLSRLPDLEETRYLVSMETKNRLVRSGRLALVNYVQSDCGGPSDRDHFVKMLMKHMEVDSYGECEHNKDLPRHLRDPLQGMDHDDFYKLVAQYKFTIAFENAVCNDYVTEKFWRPLQVGSVPIVFGSARIKDLLPSPHSAIVVSDYSTIEELVQHIRFLDKNDEAYEKYLSFKQTGVQNDYLRGLLSTRQWGPHSDYNKPNMIDAFECLLCTRLHENLHRAREGKAPNLHHATLQHYGCPKPQRFSDNPAGSLDLVDDEWWSAEWTFSSYLASALGVYLDLGGNFTESQVQAKAMELQHKYD